MVNKTFVEVDKKDVLSYGSFLALLKFRVNSSDTVLAEHIEKGDKILHTHRQTFRIN